MKYYLIYTKKGQYLGYATNKKMLSRFFEIRGKEKFKYLTISKKEFSKNVNSFDILEDTRMDYMDLIYNVDQAKIPIFMWEYPWLDEMLNDSLNDINDLITHILLLIDYLKLTKKEKKIIRHSFENLFEVTHDMMDALQNEPLYDEMFKLENVFKHPKFSDYE